MPDFLFKLSSLPPPINSVVLDNPGSSFTEKLFQLLEIESPEVVRWLNHGLAFKIMDPLRFSLEVLPKYFRHTKISSFQRQLNLYGFRKITKGRDVGATFHPSFRRGCRELLSGVKRVAVKGMASSLDNDDEMMHGDAADYLREQVVKAPYNLSVSRRSHADSNTTTHSKKQKGVVPLQMSQLSMNLGFTGNNLKIMQAIQEKSHQNVKVKSVTHENLANHCSNSSSSTLRDNNSSYDLENKSVAEETTFPEKLFILLESESPELIRWLNHGLAFKVVDPDRFAQEVLPKYFRHTNLSSFQRQLNLYGFRKITKGHDIGATFHPSFQKGNRELTSEIKRMPVKNSQSLYVTDLEEDSFFDMEGEGNKYISTEQLKIGHERTCSYSILTGTKRSATEALGDFNSYSDGTPHSAIATSAHHPIIKVENVLFDSNSTSSTGIIQKVENDNMQQYISNQQQQQLIELFQFRHLLYNQQVPLPYSQNSISFGHHGDNIYTSQNKNMNNSNDIIDTTATSSNASSSPVFPPTTSSIDDLRALLGDSSSDSEKETENVIARTNSFGSDTSFDTFLRSDHFF